MTHRFTRRASHGFTLLELLVAIGILAVLIAIGASVLRAVYDGQRRNRTRVMLGTAASMLAEFDAATALKQQPALMWTPNHDGPGTRYTTPGFNIWRDADPLTPGETTLVAPLGTVDVDDARSATQTDTRLRSQAVINTAIVMREMARVPAIKTMLAQLPSNSMINVYEDAAQTIRIGPVLLDGWGHPIIFVPAAGLSAIYLGDPGEVYAVVNFKVIRIVDFVPRPLPGVARPFFASAGPDASFGFNDVNGNNRFDPNTDVATGEDNLYSFEN